MATCIYIWFRNTSNNNTSTQCCLYICDMFVPPATHCIQEFNRFSYKKKEKSLAGWIKEIFFLRKRRRWCLFTCRATCDLWLKLCLFTCRATCDMRLNLWSATKTMFVYVSRDLRPATCDQRLVPQSKFY